MSLNSLISILMPVYNVERYIDETIKSILSQTYQQFELIIIEDGSTDKTAQIINSFSDSRIRILTNNNNLGISNSLNRGIEHSNGSYIARADGDDIAFSNRLEIQINILNEKNVDLVCSNYFNEDVETGEVTEDSYRAFSPNETKSHMFFYDITHGTVMFKKKIVANFETVYFNRPAEDYDLFVRLAQNHKFYSIPEKLVKVRIRKDSLCGQASNEINKDIDSIRLKQLLHLDITPTDEEKKLHLSLINRNYKYLSQISLQDIYKWIDNIIEVNNNWGYFPKTYFNNQWHLRALHSLKNRDSRKISDVMNYRSLSKKLENISNIKNLLYLYRYKYKNTCDN